MGEEREKGEKEVVDRDKEERKNGGGKRERREKEWLWGRGGGFRGHGSVKLCVGGNIFPPILIPDIGINHHPHQTGESFFISHIMRIIFLYHTS